MSQETGPRMHFGERNWFWIFASFVRERCGFQNTCNKGQFRFKYVRVKRGPTSICIEDGEKEFQLLGTSLAHSFNVLCWNIIKLHVFWGGGFFCRTHQHQRSVFTLFIFLMRWMKLFCDFAFRKGKSSPRDQIFGKKNLASISTAVTWGKCTCVQTLLCTPICSIQNHIYLGHLQVGQA